MPLRWLSSDGTCDIQLYLTGTTTAQATIAHASGRMIKAAAQSVLDRCVASRSRMGGVASNIGGDNNLAVGVKLSRHPGVRCLHSSAPPMRAVGELVNVIPASLISQVFGLEGDAGTQTVLPAVFNSKDRSCRLEVSTPSGIADSASWYDMWDMATAIRDMCVSQGMAGEAVGLGDNGRLMLQVVKVR
ncbi:MAG: hypothetical protein Q9194_007161 [Teloschistes cf. exilis]